MVFTSDRRNRAATMIGWKAEGLWVNINMNNQKTLEGKCAIVTGAGRGIGRAVALALADEGAKLILVSRTEEELKRVAEEAAFRAGRPCAIPSPADISVEEDVRRIAAHAETEFGCMDILVNNAGAAFRKPLAQTTATEWDNIMAVNARGPFLMCRECIPLLKREAGGFIVNIASVVAVKGYENQSAYGASKHALLGMTKALARETQPLGIRVHAICPGGVATPMISEMRPDLDQSGLMTPEEIAEIVVFLVTRKGNAVIDQINVRREASEPSF